MQSIKLLFSIIFNPIFTKHPIQMRQSAIIHGMKFVKQDQCYIGFLYFTNSVNMD